MNLQRSNASVLAKLLTIMLVLPVLLGGCPGLNTNFSSGSYDEKKEALETAFFAGYASPFEAYVSHRFQEYEEYLILKIECGGTLTPAEQRRRQKILEWRKKMGEEAMARFLQRQKLKQEDPEEFKRQQQQFVQQVLPPRRQPPQPQPPDPGYNPGGTGISPPPGLSGGWSVVSVKIGDKWYSNHPEAPPGSQIPPDWKDRASEVYIKKDGKEMKVDWNGGLGSGVSGNNNGNRTLNFTPPNTGLIKKR